MEVAVAEHQVQWEKEEVEREEVEGLQIKRHRWPEIITAPVDFSDVISADALETGTEDEPGNKSNQVESKDEISVVENIISCRYQLIPKVATSSDIKIFPTEKPAEDREITQVSGNKPINGIGVLKEDTDEELNDLDVERVLKEQNAYNLFCPNCKSCITRRVILRKRKRGEKIIIDEDRKRNKPEIVDEPLLGDIPEHTTDVRESEPEVFRCLACFTFFIPKGVKTNWLSSLFSQGKQEIIVDKDGVAASEQITPSPLVVTSTSKDTEVTGKDEAKRGERSDEPRKGVSGTKVDIHIEKPPKANVGDFSPSLTTSLLLPDKQVNVTQDLVGLPEKATAGGDTVIIITDETQTETCQPSHPAITESVEERGFIGVEVIKSIVYGGLIESITSLGIVSSAAGANTAIINIVALALANLIGGLFVIHNNLWDLKKDNYGVINSVETENTPSQGTQRLDKYRDLLGRRENFSLHATVAIISYIIFGLIPPVIYGFSFHESSDRDFKLIAVAVASLLCITVLAVGKVYVQSPPKNYIKTVFYYITLGVTVSGASYVAGDLINKLIQELGWLSSGVDLPEWSSS